MGVGENNQVPPRLSRAMISRPRHAEFFHTMEANASPPAVEAPRGSVHRAAVHHLNFACVGKRVFQISHGSPELLPFIAADHHNADPAGSIQSPGHRLLLTGFSSSQMLPVNSPRANTI